MNRQLFWRGLLVVVIVAGAVALILTRSPRLGLDLRGGSQIVLEASDTERQAADDDALDRTLEVLRRRVDQLGVAEPSLQRSGSQRIIVELPGLTDPEQAVEVIGRTAQLEFRPVLAFGAPDEVVDPLEQTAEPGEEPEAAEPGSEAAVAPGEEPEAEPGSEADPQEAEAPADDDSVVLTDELGRPLRVGPPVVTGDVVRRAAALLDETGLGWQVNIDFQRAGSERWEQLTADAACFPQGDPQRLVSIVLDGEIISAPQVGAGVQCGEGITGGTTVISGNFSETEAKDLALLIRAGALPVPVEIVEQRTLGPTLGQEAIAASTRAAIIGASLTILYMIVYYKVVGGAAALALMLYGLISFATLLALNATLTLPGIAGFMLAIGMAVDANVLVFERVREEYALKDRPGASVQLGFQKAMSAIADSNITTLLAATLLFFLASGAVRGFGVTLSVGVVVSIFTALVVTRVIVELLVRVPALRKRPRLLGVDSKRRLMRWLDARQPDLIGRSKLWFAISAAAVLLALGGLLLRDVNYGVEFTGGRLMEFSTERPVDPVGLRADLTDLGLATAVVQESGQGNVSIRTGELSGEMEAEVRNAVSSAGGQVDLVRDEFVGPSIGAELRQRALIALGLALLAQLTYLAFRFRWNFGLSAVVATFHDVVILVGIFVWFGKQIDGVFLAALLTVIGYSINDSVVVFDRVREQRRERTGLTMKEAANDACLRTIPRTVNTGLGALFILVALYLLGGDTLSDFALALIIGLTVGSYSSIFTAAPVSVALDRWKPAPPPVRKPPAKRRPPPSSRRPSSGRPRR